MSYVLTSPTIARVRPVSSWASGFALDSIAQATYVRGEGENLIS
jgi:hypothetical protein